MSGVNSYEKYRLLKELTLAEKVEWSRGVIKKALYGCPNAALSFSWGKDSIVAWHLIKEQEPNILCIYANTGVEYPETNEFKEWALKNWKMNYLEVKGDKTFFELVNEYGYPHARQRSCQDHVGQPRYRAPKCCVVLKEKPLKNKQKELGIDLVFWGIQATESMNRRLLFLKRGEFYYAKTDKVWRCAPLMIWTDKDVFEYCKINNIALPKIYEKMNRNGCMFCTAFKSWEKVMQSYDDKIYAGFIKAKNERGLSLARNKEGKQKCVK
jgi:3'-phosphoadenosine 5'-phosphosulfate sulfotransferase (PAPS reductase)/FAD synthetase